MDAGSYFCKLLPRRPLGNCGALETRWGGQQATSAENAVNGVGGVRGWGGAVGNCLSQKCERANRWGRLKVTAAEIKGGRVRGLKAGGAGVSWEVTFAKIGRRRAFGTLTGGREVTFKGTASGGGGKNAGGGASEKLLPRKSRRRKGAAKEWEIISATCASRPNSGGVATTVHSRPEYLPNAATQGARRRRLPGMRDMPTQCVLGDFRRNASEIRTPWFGAP